MEKIDRRKSNKFIIFKCIQCGCRVSRRSGTITSDGYFICWECKGTSKVTYKKIMYNKREAKMEAPNRSPFHQSKEKVIHEKSSGLSTVDDIRDG